MAKTLALGARPVAKGKHQRTGQRPNVRRYPPDGQEWGTVGWPDLVDTVPATGATAGIPGSWTPAGATPPSDVSNLINGNPATVVANPATPWTAGQYVQTGTAGAAGRACWTGSAWVGGVAPSFDPGSTTIANVQAHVDGLTLTGDELRAEVQRILDAERAGQNRTTLVNWLDAKLGVI